MNVGDRVSYLTGVRLRVGNVVEVKGEHSRVKWEYSQHERYPETRHADGKRTWVQTKKLVKLSNES